MQYIPARRVIPIAVVFLFIQFGGLNYCNQFFELNMKYSVECSPPRNNARSSARNTPANAGPQTTKSPAPTPTPSTTARATTAQSTHCIQRGPVDLKDPHHAIELHPVSRLHEIQAKLHQTEPIFKVLGHRGEQNKNNLEYNVQVVINDKSASAWAHTKKEAKRRAAIAMLNLMGLPVEGDGTNAIC